MKKKIKIIFLVLSLVILLSAFIDFPKTFKNTKRVTLEIVPTTAVYSIFNESFYTISLSNIFSICSENSELKYPQVTHKSSKIILTYYYNENLMEKKNNKFCFDQKDQNYLNILSTEINNRLLSDIELLKSISDESQYRSEPDIKLKVINKFSFNVPSKNVNDPRPILFFFSVLFFFYFSLREDKN